MLATRALARLAGVFDSSATPYNLLAANALRALLTPKLAAMLSDSNSSEALLRNLTSNLESPEVNLQFNVCQVKAMPLFNEI